MVQTVNGKITNGDDSDIYKWTSKEDADFFFKFLSDHKLIVMGSGTYEASKEKIKPRVGQLRIILTGNPKKYKKEEVLSLLEFRNQPPIELIHEMQDKGYKKMLLVGGSETNKAFFEEGLVDEIYLTIEPLLFGNGKSLIAAGAFTQKLRLVSSQKLNERGTLLLHYTVEHAKK